MDAQQPVEEDLMQSVSALAALVDRKVQVSIGTGRWSLAADIVGRLQATGGIVQHLGATLGHSLTFLQLSNCTILHDFWPAVWRHLPGLQELELLTPVIGAVSSRDIAAFCSHATRPLRLVLGRRVYSSVGPPEHLEQQCRTWGVPQVTVTEL
jgi:hypothetical protein